MKIKTRHVFGGILSVLFLLWLNPYYRCLSESALRRIYIWRTPLGSSSKQVVGHTRHIRSHRNIEINDVPGLDRGDNGYTILIGSKSIGPVDIGWYFTSFLGVLAVTYVFVTWAFDDNDKLIDVLVHKEIDAP